MVLLLPNSCTLILWNEKRVGFLNVEGSVPLVDVACNALIIVHGTQCHMQSAIVSDILSESLLTIDLLAVGMGSCC